MIRNLVRLGCVLLVAMSCVGLFVLKNKVIDREEELKALHRQIIADIRDIHVLEAEWAYLNDPENLRKTMESVSTTLKPVSAAQVIESEVLPMKVAPTPSLKPEFSEEEKE